MRRSSKSGVMFTLASLIAVCTISIASASSLSQNGTNGPLLLRGTAATGTVMIRPHSTAATHTPTCQTVPTSLFTTDLGTSMIFTGTSASNGRVTMGTMLILVGGKPLTGEWMICSYAHNPKNLGETNLAVSYFDAPTSSKALAVLKAMCVGLRSFATNYTTPAIGNGACVQGHTGYMQSSNGLLAVGHVVVQLFGSQSPAQSTALARGIAPRITKANWATTFSSGPPKYVPDVVISTTQFNTANGFMPLSLSCTVAKCSGVAELTELGVTGTVVLATTPYSVLKQSKGIFNLMLTADGSNFFGSASTNPVQVKLQITVAGGKSVDRVITVSYATTTTTSPTTTTTLATTTTG